MKAGGAGKVRALAKGKGANVAAGDGQPLAGTVRAVLVNEDTGFCAAATFADAQITDNDCLTFKAKAP